MFGRGEPDRGEFREDEPWSDLPSGGEFRGDEHEKGEVGQMNQEQASLVEQKPRTGKFGGGKSEKFEFG